MRETDLGYQGSGEYLTDTLLPLQREHSGIVSRQGREQIAPIAPIESLQSIDGVGLDEVSTLQVINTIAPNRAAETRHKLLNPHGGPIKPAKHGAKGIAGIRADIISGKLTIRELSLMPLSQIAKRYSCSKPVAFRLRQHVCQYGVDGKHRTITGERKPLPK